MTDILITPDLSLSGSEVSITAIRSQGAGGQHVNKTSTAIQLRFDIASSSLPGHIKQRLLSRSDQRINREGVLTIKSQQSRSQEQNRNTAIELLATLIRTAMKKPKPRKRTKPGKSAIARRLDTKKRQGQVKSLRQKIRH